MRPGAVTESRVLDDGRGLDVYPLLWGRARMLVTLADEIETDFADDAWEFDSIVRALDAQASWDGTGEPAGWDRHPKTGRRRPDGDPERETVHP